MGDKLGSFSISSKHPFSNKRYSVLLFIPESLANADEEFLSGITGGISLEKSYISSFFKA